jgi:acyl carrier protein
MNTTVTDIFKFLSEELSISIEELNINSDINEDLGVDGDDFFELMEAFSKNFNVDISNYLWYFHHGEEGLNIPGGIFFKPPYNRVNRIVITPKILLESANSRKWLIEYPEHNLPKKRYDILINQLLFGLFFILVLVALLTKST